MKNFFFALALSLALAPLGAQAAGNALIGDAKPQTLTAIYRTCADDTGLVTGYKVTTYVVIGKPVVEGIPTLEFAPRNRRVDFSGKSAHAVAYSFWCRYYTAQVTPELIDAGLVYPPSE